MKSLPTCKSFVFVFVFCLYKRWNQLTCISYSPLSLSTRSKNVKTYVLQPLVVGAAAAFGMSIGKSMPFFHLILISNETFETDATTKENANRTLTLA